MLLCEMKCWCEFYYWEIPLFFGRMHRMKLFGYFCIVLISCQYFILLIIIAHVNTWHASLSLSFPFSLVSPILSSPRLSPTSENTLKQLYNKTARNSTDPYKKAVYCVLGRCELNNTHFQVLVKTEDYMWLKVSYFIIIGLANFWSYYYFLL